MKHYTVTSNGALTILNAQEARDIGTYCCKANNIVGTIVSLKAKLDFPFLNPFTVPLVNVNANPGDPLKLTCDAPDTQPLSTRSIRWSKRDVRLSSNLPPLEKRNYYSVSKNGDLYFSYVTSADTGSYVCVVGNTALGRSEERTVRVKVDLLQKNTYTVRAPSVFKDFSHPKFAVKGKSFVLECIAQGRPVPKISLKKKGKDTELGKVLANKRTYVIRRFNAEDAGDYVCTTSNDYGDSSERTTTIQMLVEAQWIKRPEDAAVDVNSSHTWKCEAEGVPPITYKWFYNGIRMKKSARYHIKEGTLTFPVLSLKDKGMYQCSASNDVKELMASAELDVKAAPASFGEGSVPPSETTYAVKGGTAEISCKPVGAPKPKVTWMRGSTILGTSAGKHEITSEGTLRIKNIEKKDKGSYTCVGKNSLGLAKKDGYLVVKDDVAIVNFQTQASAIVGKNLSLTCQADARKGTIVSFEWTQNFMAIVEPNVFIKHYTKDKKSVMFIKHITLANRAAYFCTATVYASNGHGEVSDTAEVIVDVKGPPKAPSSISVTKVRHHHVNITWIPQANNNSPLKNVIIQYQTLYEPDTWYIAQHVPFTGDDKAEVKLSPWAFYRFRVILENGVGRSKPSPESALVESPASVPDKAPRNITGFGESPTELTISWQHLKPIDHNGPGLHYAVFYRKVQDTTPMSRVEVHVDSAKKRHAYTITDTDFYEQFEFQVQAINALGQGPKSTIVYGYSGERSPVGEPQNLRVKIMNSRSARATWTGIRHAREATRGKLLGYKVYYWSTQYGIRPSDAQYEPTGETVTMLGLDSFTTYFFQVVAYNSKGDGPGSNVVGPLATPESVPQAPFSLDIHVSNPEVTLTWKPPLKPNGIMVGYQVTVKKLPMGQVNIIDVNHQRLEQVFEALDLSGKYQFALLARNRVGFGPPLVVNFDLKTVPKQPPDDVFITKNEKQRVVTVKWSKVAAKVDGYRVTYWNTKDGPEKSLKFQEVDDKSTREVKIPNLERTLTYKIHVGSFQEYGDNIVFGPKSKIHTVSIGKSKSSIAFALRAPSWLWFIVLIFTALSLQR